jgi:hypothetical protein
MLELFRTLMLALSLTLAGPNMGCDRQPGRETYCWLVDGNTTTILTPRNIEYHWPKLIRRWGLKPIETYRPTATPPARRINP